MLKDFEFDPFVLVNSYLVHRAVENNFNVLFQIPAKDYRKKYHVPTFIVLAIQTFIENWIGYEYSVNIGDVLLEENGSTREIVAKNNGRYETKKLDKNNTRGYLSERQVRRFPIITGRVREAKLKTKISAYQEFFKNLLGCPKEQIPYKQKIKTLIVASKKVTNELKSLKLNGHAIYKSFPIEYLWEKRDRSIGRECNLPIEPMIYLTNDFELAERHLLSSGLKEVEKVVFIGASQYMHNIASITDAYNRYKLKSFILIGSENVDHLPALYKWRWYAPEISILQGNGFFPPETMKVSAPEIEVNLIGLFEALKMIEDEFEVDLSPLNYHIKKTANLILPIQESRLIGVFKNYWDYILDEGKEIVVKSFFDMDYDFGDVEENWDVVKGQFKRLFNGAINSLGKPDVLLKQEGLTHIVVSKKHKEIWESDLGNINKLTFITFSEFKILQTKKPASVAFLGYYGIDQMKAMVKSPHRCILLLYEHEKKLYELDYARYENSILNELKSEWRQTISGFTFSMPPKKETVSGLLERLSSKIKGSEKGHQYNGAAHNLRIIFENGGFREINAEAKILLKAVDGYQEYQANMLKTGDVVAEYFNVDKETLYNVALNADSTDVFKKIEQSSKVWKDELRRYFEDQKLSIEFFYTKLKNAGLKVGIDTLKNWLHPNCSVKFPQRKKDLTAINYLIKSTLLGNELGQIFHDRSVYKSIMISLGQGLSDETTTYLKTGKKGRLFEKFSEKQIQSIIQRNIQLKTVQEIKFINHHEQVSN